MKKNLKVLAAAILVSMAAGSTVFAAPVKNEEKTPVVQEQKSEIVTLTGKIKVTGKGEMSFEVKKAPKYKLIVSDDEMISVIKSRKNKMLILSGYADDVAKTFEVVAVGGLNSNGSDK